MASVDEVCQEELTQYEREQAAKRMYDGYDKLLGEHDPTSEEHRALIIRRDSKIAEIWGVSAQ